MEADNPYTKIDKLNSTAREIYKASPEEAQELAYKAVEMATDEYYLRGVAEGHNVLYWLYLKEYHNREKANYHLKAYKAANTELKELIDLSSLNYAKGYRLYAAGNYTDATPLLLDSYDIAVQQRAPKKAATSLYTVALIFKQTGWPDKSISYLNKIATDEISDEFKISVFKLKGMLYYDRKNYVKAIEAYNSGIQIAKERGDNKQTIKLLEAVALPLIHTRQYQEASETIQLGLKLADDTGDRHLYAELLMKQGLLMEKQNRYAESIGYHTEATVIFSSTGHTGSIASAYLALSHVYSLAGDSKLAREAALKGLAYQDEAPYGTAMELLQNMSLLSRNLGDETAYYKYRSEALSLQNKDLQSSHYEGVHKAELDYRSRVGQQELDEFLAAHEQAMADKRIKQYAVLLGILLLISVTIIMVLNLAPMRQYDKMIRTNHTGLLKVMASIDEWMKHLRLMRPEPVAKPAAPDEHDLHDIPRRKRDDDDDDGKPFED
ncbi:MAG: hypothetical protein WBG62_04005 [Cyclobacteriaceae bacterium]